MIEKVFKKLQKHFFVPRSYTSVKINSNVFTLEDESLGHLTYSLQGSYSYKEVNELNSLTLQSAIFAYCKEKGPIAIIGLYPEKTNWKYFCEVCSYGEIIPTKEFEIKQYSENTAKRIKNYTVYGLSGIDKIANFVKFNKISSIYDSRYDDIRHSHKLRSLNVKGKFEGQYSFEEIEDFTKTQYRWFVDRVVTYATLETGEHIAIMSFHYERRNEISGFQDVWELGKAQPPIQKISFMTVEEAMKINIFSLYLYDYDFYSNPDIIVPKLMKLDRTLNPNFDFYDNTDGKDLRLITQI